MRPMPWQAPVDLSPEEQAVARRVRRAKLFVFLRTHRHTLFDAAFQEELATLYADRPKVQPPVPPARLALVTLLHAYTGASDAEAVEATVMDRRWQRALDCLDCADAPFSVGTLVSFETEVAAQPESPARAEAQEHVAVARQVHAQDVEEGPGGTATLRRGVAPDRRISVEDADMRQGRKSRTHLIDGYKRPVRRDLDHAVVRAVGLPLVNAPEATVTDALEADLAAQGATLAEIHSDRASLGRTLVRERGPEVTISCKAWPVRQGDHFAKTAFHLDWARQVLTCPHGEEMPFVPGGLVHVSPQTCQACPRRDRCTPRPHGRSVSIHRDERLLQELRERQQTAAGRAALRERVQVAHSLAPMGAGQGDRARYRGQRKNLFDTRRMGAIENVHIIQRCPPLGDLPQVA